MKKAIIAVFELCMSMLTGCSVDQQITINKDLSSQSVVKMYTTTEEEKAIEQSMADEESSETTSYAELMGSMGYVFAGTETINGVEHNNYTANAISNAEETKAMFVELTGKKAVYNIAADTEVATDHASETSSQNYNDMGFSYLRIKYPFAVAKTNGTLQSDGYTVEYDLAQMQNQKIPRAYALSAAALANSDTITIKGVKKNKIYKKAVIVKVSSKGAITSFKVNDTDQATNEFYADEDGKYKVSVKTATGKKKTLKFIIDRKKPTTNIKNNKTYKKSVTITFKDDVSGVKKALLNGKKIKSGKTVKKNGSYTLKIVDKANNTRTVKFSIKK